MLKTFKYRIYPTKSQTRLLNNSIELCRNLYNSALEERIMLYRSKRKCVNYYYQANQLKQLKKELPEYNQVYSQVMQNTLQRLERTFQSFFNRLRQHQTPGFPRFKGKSRYNSITYTQSGWKINNSKLKLSKIGDIKIILHRKFKGKLKTCSIIKTKTNKWFVCITTETTPTILPQNQNIIGIDMGIESFLTDDRGNKIKYPKYYIKKQKELARLSRQQDKTKKGSEERKEINKKLAKTYEKITNQRNDFQHKISREIINSNQIICVEDLNINQLQQKSNLNKYTGDCAWGNFIMKLSYKAEEAGRIIVKVNPTYTSQTCNNCGKIEEKKLSDRLHNCSCGYILDRDINAAKNIKRLGLQSLIPYNIKTLYRVFKSSEV